MPEVKGMEMLTQIIRHIVDHPEQVAIEEQSSNRGIALMVSVHDDDVGKVIGREGRVINALRQIVRVCGLWPTQRITIDLAGK